MKCWSVISIVIPATVIPTFARATKLALVSLASTAIAVFALMSNANAESALADAIKAGDHDAAMQMIRKHANVNTTQADGTTPLHWAVYKVDVELTKALLARGAKADVKNNLGSTPLVEAARVANVELIQLLLKAGAKTETANEDGQTPLMLAARTGLLPVVEVLVKHGANVNAREQWHGQTPLMWAAANNFPDVTEYLIAHGANVSARAFANDWPAQVTSEPRAQYRPTGGLTPLLYAARSGCDRCVIAMLKAGADINLPNPDGVTPLMNAIDNMHFDLAKHLLEQGANPHTWDWWGRTPLYIAVDVRTFANRGPAAARADKLTSLDMMQLLLETGVNPNPQLNMHRPGRGGNSGRFTDDLLTAGATPLLRAATAYDDEAIRVLLAHGALIDLPNVMGATPFMAAAGIGLSIRDPLAGIYTSSNIQARSIATMELLLKAGADINTRISDTSTHTGRIARPSSMSTRQGQTALFGAINWGWTDVVKYLLAHGARVDIVDAAGKTTLDAITGNAGGRDFVRVEEISKLVKAATEKSSGVSMQPGNK